MATIRFQLIKSVTSTAANYRAVCRARSDREFFAKISILVEEVEELVSIFATSRKTAGNKLKDGQ